MTVVEIVFIKWKNYNFILHVTTYMIPLTIKYKNGGKIMNRQQLINKANQLGLTIKSENMETISKMIRTKEEEIYQKLNSERKANHIKRVWSKTEIKPKRFQIIRDVIYQGRKWSEDVLEVDDLSDYFDNCLFLIESTMFEYKIKNIKETV